MKCGYGEMCKFGGEVEKSVAIKIGSRYWHKRCVKEKELKSRIVEEFYAKFKSKEPNISARKAVKKYIHELDYEAEYVLYCLLYKAKNLNSLHGLIYSLNDNKNMKDYKKLKAKATDIEFNQPINDYYDEEVVKINSKKAKRWGDIL